MLNGLYRQIESKLLNGIVWRYGANQCCCWWWWWFAEVGVEALLAKHTSNQPIELTLVQQDESVKTHVNISCVYWQLFLPVVPTSLL